MRSFFIDLENVRSYGLEGILLLKPDDKVYVFYSDNANTLTIPTIESLNESSASVKYIKTNYIGANAMDFQIVTLLGASIEKEQKGSFYIISHDNGFKSAVKFCEGYFTGYDIVTGVFANILLALNSEKNGKKIAPQKNTKETPAALGNNETEPASDQEKDQKETSGSKNKRRRSRNQRNKKNTGAVQNEQDANLSETTALNEVTPLTTSEPAEDTAAENSSSDSKELTGENENRKSRSRNNRRRSRNKNRSDEGKGTASTENEVSSGSDMTNDGFMIIQASGEETEKESVKPHKENKKKSPDEKAQHISKSSNYKYVYSALSDYLSKNTIEMYASKIDEGIRKSSNREELHKFFKNNYGSDEAEALYKIIYSDFDKMKKEAGK